VKTVYYGETGGLDGGFTNHLKKVRPTANFAVSVLISPAQPTPT